MQTENESSPIALCTPSPVRDLEYLIQKLISKYSPLQIFCFHERVERRAVNCCFLAPIEEEQCNYYLLMVTESPSRIEHAVQDFANHQWSYGGTSPAAVAGLDVGTH